MLIFLRTLSGLALSLLGSGAVMGIEIPPYKVLSLEAAFEIRQYEAVLVAETVVEGDMSTASSSGFRLLADFIFGNNLVPGTDQAGKIAMTAPVTLEPQSAKIAMTATVTLEPLSAETNMQTATQWRVDFVMPRQYTLENIPKPKNSAVKLRQVPGKVLLVHKFSGLGSLSTVQQKTDEMLAWAARKGYKTIGSVQLARYDPPWTLPMFRRNEILIEIAKP